MIEQRPVSVLRLRQPFHEVRQHGDVIAVQSGVFRFSLHVFPMMRTGMERNGGAAFGVAAHSEITREEQRGDASDVGTERQSQQVELQLDVLIEGFRNPDRDDGVRRCGGRRLCRDLQSPFDLAHIVGVFIEAQAVGRIEADLEPRQAGPQRVEDAAVVLPARGSLFCPILAIAQSGRRPRRSLSW